MAIPLDRPRTDAEPCRDRAVAGALDDLTDDLPLAAGQDAVEPSVRRNRELQRLALSPALDLQREPHGDLVEEASRVVVELGLGTRADLPQEAHAPTASHHR